MSTEMFEQFYKKTYNLVYHYVRAKACFKFQIEDIMQDIYYIAYLKKDIILDHENPEGWVVMIAKNILMQYTNKEIKDRNAKASNDQCLEYTETRSQEDSYSLLEMEEIFQKYLSRDEYRMFSEFYIEGYSGKELQAKYKISNSCLKMRLNRIKEKVRCVLH